MGTIGLVGATVGRRSRLGPIRKILLGGQTVPNQAWLRTGRPPRQLFPWDRAFARGRQWHPQIATRAMRTQIGVPALAGGTVKAGTPTGHGPALRLSDVDMRASWYARTRFVEPPGNSDGVNNDDVNRDPCEMGGRACWSRQPRQRW